MTDQELFELDQMGFIPGPGEDEESFRARIARTQENFNRGQWIPAAQWDWVREYLGQLFNVKPLYICAFYSNRSLAPWQGAASWIEGRTLHSIQLRKALKKGNFLKIYKREEILAHEAVHATRSAFNENQYEEFFAYMTSESRWRRVFGPILQRPWEAWPFLLFTLAGLFWPLFYWGTTFWALCGFQRLIRLHRTLKKAAREIQKTVKDPSKARAILFRLTDREIHQFSRKESVLPDATLRWRVIQNYFKERYGQENHC